MSYVDERMDQWTTRQYFAWEDGPEEWKAWNKSWKQRHPEWYPDKDGLPWDEYWDKYWKEKSK